MMGEKLSELSDNELGALVAEKMGAKWIEYKSHPFGCPGYWKFPNGDEIMYWDPCNRAEHWWRVVEWVREEPEHKFLRRFFFDALIPRPNIPIGSYEPLQWFLWTSNPGRAICEAYVEATE